MVVSILVLIFAVPIFKLFTTSEAIITLGVKVLAVDIFLEFGRCANVIIINCLRAAGDVQFPVYIGIMSMWGVSVLFGYIFEKWESLIDGYDEEHFSYGEKYMVTPPDDGEARLLKAYNTSKFDRAFDTMMSMRNVDVSVGSSVLIWED